MKELPSLSQYKEEWLQQVTLHFLPLGDLSLITYVITMIRENSSFTALAQV